MNPKMHLQFEAYDDYFEMGSNKEIVPLLKPAISPLVDISPELRNKLVLLLNRLPELVEKAVEAAHQNPGRTSYKISDVGQHFIRLINGEMLYEDKTNILNDPIEEPAGSIPVSRSKSEDRRYLSLGVTFQPSGLMTGKEFEANRQSLSPKGQAVTFQSELSSLINRFSMENGSNTPDFLLAEFLSGCLELWNKTTKAREKWYGVRSTGTDILQVSGRQPRDTPKPDTAGEPDEGIQIVDYTIFGKGDRAYCLNADMESAPLPSITELVRVCWKARQDGGVYIIPGQPGQTTRDPRTVIDAIAKLMPWYPIAGA